MTAAAIFGFRPYPVTLLAVVTYVVLGAVLLWNHQRVPAVASPKEVASWGVDLDEAWSDLQEITRQFHPYNSRFNDHVRAYLLQRIEDMRRESKDAGYEGRVEVFDDAGAAASNVTFAGSAALTVYFEGTNIMVYIEGTEPDASPVMVNAHYDSVSTGYGATDDGVGVVTVLQVIKSFIRPGASPPKRGLIALLNNGEEDYLNGARAFAMHPLSAAPHAFLNLEGAGAGGRAILFRSTDAEVTKFYKASKRPTGTSISADGFKSGFVRSQTDYKVFDEDLHMRGLDVAFWRPRSYYHTKRDSTAYTGKRSLWHMLGTSLQTLSAMTSDTSKVFDPSRPGGPPAGKGHDAAWFDLFGRTFALLRLHTVFALAVTLLVVPAVGMLLTLYLLHRFDRLYLFHNASLYPSPPVHSHLPTTTRGWRGFTRLPIAGLVATAACVGVAFALDKINPMVAYSSEYAVWTLMLSLWLSLAWFLLSMADRIRPTALARGYAFVHQWMLWWAVLVAAAVGMDQAGVASGYWVLLVYAPVWLASWIGLLELSAAPRKAEYCGTTAPLLADDEHDEEREQDEEHEDEDTENTPLFRGENRPTSFAYGTRGRQSAPSEEDTVVEAPAGVYGAEQAWSASLPSWLWLPQFLLAVPLPLVVVGQAGLFLISAIAQSGADGNSMLPLYVLTAVLATVLLLPLSPFLHRVTWPVGAFVALVAVGTAVYSLTAFPFSETRPLKVYFQQQVDLDTGAAAVLLVGHDRYVGLAAAGLPSARGHDVAAAAPHPLRAGLTRVTFPGALPNVAPGRALPEWLHYDVAPRGPGRARIFVVGRETRNCKLLFDRPVYAVRVLEATGGAHHAHANATPPALGAPVPPTGATEVRLWSREWERGWTVDVDWRAPAAAASADGADGADEGGMTGRAVCMWADANDAANTIPAFEEVRRFLPPWAVVTKLTDGLVEGSRNFTI